MPDAFVVALDLLALGALRAPSEPCQKPADMVDVILHAEFLLDQIADSRTAPQVIRESGGLGALEEKPFKFFHLNTR